MKLIDMTKQPLEFFKVIGREDPMPGRQRRWIVRCECGRETLVRGERLRSGATRSCGCKKGEFVSQVHKTHGEAHHGKATPEYRAWGAMKSRCYYEKDVGYPDYGGRGIVVCERWLNSFEAFLADMGRRPSPEHSLERKDVNGNYEPGNCVWATLVEQGRNRRVNHVLSFRGQEKCIAAWAEELGLKPVTIANRLRRGWTVERALTEPLGVHGGWLTGRRGGRP